MAKQKNVHRVQIVKGQHNVIHQLLEGCDIRTDKDVQDTLKEFLGGTIKEVMEAE